MLVGKVVQAACNVLGPCIQARSHGCQIGAQAVNIDTLLDHCVVIVVENVASAAYTIPCCVIVMSCCPDGVCSSLML